MTDSKALRGLMQCLSCLPFYFLPCDQYLSLFLESSVIACFLGAKNNTKHYQTTELDSARILGLPTSEKCEKINGLAVLDSIRKQAEQAN